MTAALADYRLLHGDDTSLTITEQDEEDDVSNASTAPVGGLRTAAEEADDAMKAGSAGGNAAGSHSARPPEQAAAGPGPSPPAGVTEVDLEHSPEGPPAGQPQAFIGASTDLFPEFRGNQLPLSGEPGALPPPQDPGQQPTSGR